MKIGLFTDSYFPQISGVATSIQTLMIELKRQGHQVYIFTTTDSNADLDHEADNIIRLQSIPFVSLAERKIVVKGAFAAFQIAQNYHLDIIHTQTEFGMGILGKLVANQLQIPVIHTLHTKYEDYLHYIAKGRLIRPPMVKYIIRNFLRGTEGVICPSEMVLETVNSYNVEQEKRVIPTGIEVEKFKRDDISDDDVVKLREELGISDDESMILSLSRIAPEKNIQAVISAMPEIIKSDNVKLVIVGDGPYLQNLKDLALSSNLTAHVIFTGRVENDKTAYYYKAADYFISASTSETQGLTYLEALAAGTRVLATENPYLSDLINDVEFGRLFANDDEIPAVVHQALAEKHPIDQVKFDEKLYEISAEKFGQEVLSFYQDTIEAYNKRNDEKRETISGKMELNLRGLPLKAAKNLRREQIRSKYLMKKAIKLTKNLQNYGKIEDEKD